MSTRRLRHLAPTLLLILVFAALPAAAKRLDGVFIEVRDANVVVLDYGKGTYVVRLYGTEAPADGQPFAAEAKAFVRERLLGRQGAIRFKYFNDRDEMVSRIFYRDPSAPDLPERDLAVDLVTAGLAWIRPGSEYKPSDDIHPDELTAAGIAAQSARRGVWSQAHPVAPWTFRGDKAPVALAPTGMTDGVVGTLDRNTSQKSGDDNECAIAKNPANTQQLFIFCNTSSAGMFAARSTDGGATWIYPDPSDKTIVDGDAGQGIAACCDPSLAWDSFGNLFVSYLGNSPISVETLLSTDGGATFTQLPTLAASGNDQQTVTTADISGGNHVVWVVWNNGSTLVASGAPVTGLGAVGAFSPVQSAGTSSCSFGDIAVSPGGAVVQVCGPQTGQGPGNIVVNTDADGIGGSGFGPPVIASTTNVGGFDKIPAQNSRSVDSETGLAYDRNPASPHFGRLYLVYTQEVVDEGNDTNVMIRHSDDNGATWSAATQINSDATSRSQFMQKIASDPATGNVAVCWHDCRNSAANTAAEMYCDSTTASSYPAFVGNTAVSDGASTSNGAGVEFGDYMGLATDASTAHPVWSDTSNSTGDNPNGTSNFDAYTDRFSMLAADYTLAATPLSQAVCAPANATYTVNVGAFGGYTDQVTLAASGNPAGTTTGFSVNPVTPVGSSVLTIGNTGAGTPGPATITVSATSTTGPKAVQLTLNLATIPAAQPTLTAPANGALNVPVPAALSWSAVPQAGSYAVQIATDAGFTNIVEQASGLASPAYSASAINTNTQYYWRVQATNACGTSNYSAVYNFRTVAAPGDCTAGTTANTLYQYGFEAGASGWTHSGTGDSWAISTTNPHSGTSLFHAGDPAAVSDQRLVSPAVALPTGQNPVVLKFWHLPNMENSGTTACYDGGILEVSTDAGATWTQVPNANLLVGPYTGAVSASFSNPLAGLQAWCNGTVYLQTIADVSAYAGQTAQFRLRLGSDTSVSDAGWDVDDVVVQSCAAALTGIFSDGFESGNTSLWSATFP